MISPEKFYNPMPKPGRVRLWLLERAFALGKFPRLQVRLLRVLGY